MKDAIDKRNEREKIAKSIVKRSNVIYITGEEAERLEREKKEREKADEILKRLEREAKEDEDKKFMEIQQMMSLTEQQENGKKSRKYRDGLDDVVQERVEAILSDKERLLQKLIQDTETGRAVPAVSQLEEELEAELEDDNAQTEEADTPEDETVEAQIDAPVLEEIEEEA